MKKPGIGICFILLLVLYILIYPVYCFSQENATDEAISLTALFDRNTAKAGSIIGLTLSFRLPEGATISKPPDIKGLEVFTVVDQQTYNNRISMRLYASQPVLFKTGGISLSYLDKEGKKQVLTAAPVSLNVLSNFGDKPEKAQLRPIQGIMPTRSLFLKYWPWACALIVVIVAGLFIFHLYRKYRRRKLLLEYVDPPHIRAKKDIEDLESQRLFEKGSIKEFYFRFSEIIKRYIENIREFPAAEYTTEEITSHIDNEKDRQILPLLRHSDLVKFADDMPTAAYKEEEVTAVLKYIDETTPVYEPKDFKKSTGGRDK
ncbi:MAG: protein BatD [Desulfobacterium sp.]|nr:protein BatD [Desulfobacterium sp.]MBU3950142.1 hypothetical protein [Pseudomonadota bacterium]MBU4037203.1 hypothetical protein [Pseudomonadota bacterium]